LEKFGTISSPVWIWIVFTFLEFKNICRARIKELEIGRGRNSLQFFLMVYIMIFNVQI
jgi:hypothetical protein